MTGAFYLSSLAKNVIAGARLAFFLPVRAHHFRASAVDFTLLAILSFALWVLVTAARLGFEGQFEPASIPVHLAGLVLILAAAMLVIYLGFILLVAFARDLMAVKIGDGVTSLGIVLGLVVIVSAFLLTGIYVQRANGRFDALTRDLQKDIA